MPIKKDLAELIDFGINNKNLNISLYDHHKTSQYLEKYPWAKIVIKNESATSLFWKFEKKFSSSELNLDYYNLLINSIKEYDTWNCKANNNLLAKKLNDVLNIIGHDDFINHYISEDYDDDDIIPEKFEYLLKYKRKEIDKYICEKMKKVKIQNSYFNNIEGKIATVLCDRIDCMSELGSKILETKDISIVFLVYDGGISLRSQPDVDCSKIAKIFGGGGHENASGFKDEKFFKWLY